jgi:hypothetical protein
LKVYLPHTSEFGFELLHVVPRIHGDSSPKIVVHEKDKDCLYPSATKRLTIGARNSATKGVGVPRETEEIWEWIKTYYGPKHTYIKPRAIRTKRKWFVPHAPDLDFECDVVVFPRKKKYMAAKNWPHWEELVLGLKEEGLRVFAGGCGDSSYHVSCPAAWDYENHLEATIHAISNSSLTVGVITALHILSVMCGTETWVLTTKDGKCHPRANTGPNWSYIKAADHLGVGSKLIPLIEDMGGIINAVAYRCSCE